jgi:hypothetical protein
MCGECQYATSEDGKEQIFFVFMLYVCQQMAETRSSRLGRLIVDGSKT